MPLQVMFRKKYHFTICPKANIFPKPHASCQFSSQRECLHTALHIAYYKCMSQKYINSMHIRNMRKHVLVCNVLILVKIYTVNIKEVTYYVSLFHLPRLSHTTLYHPRI
jgi:hypothetical protein